MNHGYDATETMVELLTSLNELGRWTGVAWTTSRLW